MRKERPDTRASIARNLNILMKARDWNQTDLAKASGVSQRHISDILNQKTGCTVEMARDLAAPFNLSEWHLMIPDLPEQLLTSPSLNRLVQSYISADADGREFLDAAAERELKRKKPI